MCTGLCMNWRDRFKSAPGMVAENSIVWCALPSSASKIASMEGKKPRSSISSASSSTTARMADRSSDPRSMWSRKRPGGGGPSTTQWLDAEQIGETSPGRPHPASPAAQPPSPKWGGKILCILRTLLNVHVRGVDTWTVRRGGAIGTVAAAGFRRARRGPVRPCVQRAKAQPDCRAALTRGTLHAVDRQLQDPPGPFRRA